MKNYLFLCTGNSCRSQMAEAWAKYYHGSKGNFFSAGIEKHGLNQFAVKVMKEIGIDISHFYSKTLSELGDLEFDSIFTVCDHAKESCPIIIGNSKLVHVGFQDPPKMAQGLQSENEILSCYREVRDEIARFVYNYSF